MSINVSLKELIESGAHFGHQSRRWNPKMEEYIYTQKEGVHVFDLTITKELLEEALEFLKKASSESKSILLLGTKKQAKEKVQEVAEETGIFYVDERWLGGTLTNFDQMKRSTKKLHDMKKKREEGEYKNRTNKERVLIDREIDRLERFFGGVADMEEIPDVLIVIDTKKESIAVKEANASGVDVIGIVDTNADPTVVGYPIPMNDDATKGVEYVLDLMKQAILEGKQGTAKKKSKAKKSNKKNDETKESSKKSKKSTKKKKAGKKAGEKDKKK